MGRQLGGSRGATSEGCARLVGWPGASPRPGGGQSPGLWGERPLGALPWVAYDGPWKEWGDFFQVDGRPAHISHTLCADCHIVRWPFGFGATRNRRGGGIPP